MCSSSLLLPDLSRGRFGDVIEIFEGVATFVWVYGISNVVRIHVFPNHFLVRHGSVDYLHGQQFIRDRVFRMEDERGEEVASAEELRRCVIHEVIDLALQGGDEHLFQTPTGPDDDVRGDRIHCCGSLSNNKIRENQMTENYRNNELPVYMLADLSIYLRVEIVAS